MGTTAAPWQERPKCASGAMFPGRWHGNTGTWPRAPLSTAIYPNGPWPETGHCLLGSAAAHCAPISTLAVPYHKARHHMPAAERLLPMSPKYQQVCRCCMGPSSTRHRSSRPRGATMAARNVPPGHEYDYNTKVPFTLVAVTASMCIFRLPIPKSYQPTAAYLPLCKPLCNVAL